jgi:hypothetical protein
MGSQVPSVLEGLSLEATSSHLNPVLGMRVKPVHFELAPDPLSDVVAISSCSSSASVDIWGQVMNLEAVLVTDGLSTGGSGISCDTNAILNMVNMIQFELTLKTTPQMVVPVLVYWRELLLSAFDSIRALLRKQLS